MSERELQLSGDFYNPNDISIVSLQNVSRKFMLEFNAQPDKDLRYNIMKKWFKTVGKNCYIEPNFFCDFGCNLSLGDNVYFNTNCTVLDSAQIFVGDNTLIGPSVQLCTPLHSLVASERRQAKMEYAKPIIIKNDCWIATGVIVLPGVTIGECSTIGAGSVVTKDIPPHSLAVGNPCKVIRNI